MSQRSRMRCRGLLALWAGLFFLVFGGVALAGSVTVTNKTVIPLEIVDGTGALIGSVKPGESMTLNAAEGDQVLTARRRDGLTYTDQRLTVPAQGGPHWEILPTEGAIEAVNRSTREVQIAIDGQILAEAQPGATVRIDGIRPGRHAITASSEGTFLAQDTVQIDARSTTVWRLEQTAMSGAGVPVLRVFNQAGRYVDIYVDGRKRLGLSPGESATMVGIPEGQVAVEARGKAGDIVASETLAPQVGQERSWRVIGAGGGRAVVEVVNKAGHTLRVCIDGSYCLRVKAGQTVQYDMLMPGGHTFEAVNLADGCPVDRFDGDLAVGVPYRWQIDPAPSCKK